MVSRTGIDIGIMIVGIMSITTGTIIAIGTTRGFATGSGVTYAPISSQSYPLAFSGQELAIFD